MNDEKGYHYVVLAKLSQDGGIKTVEYKRLGDTHLGRTPEEAIGKAAQDHAIPDLDGDGEVAAIPASKFHVRNVKIWHEPTYEITTPKVEAIPPPEDPGKPTA